MEENRVLFGNPLGFVLAESKDQKKWAKTKTNHLLVIFLDSDIPMIYVSFGSPPPCDGEWEKKFGIVTMILQLRDV